jgi:O-antigen/teichoic acid export membrane protein
MAFAVVTVQGAAYLLQVVIAAVFSPAEFGIVRSVDAVLGLLVILGSVGMPSLAVKCVAEVDDVEARGRLLVRLLLIAAGASFIGASAVWALASSLTNATAAPYLQRLVWVVPLAACARTALNYYQGTRQIRLYSMLSVSAAGGVLPLALLAVSVSGLGGWVLARYGVEAATLAVALVPLTGVLRGTGRLAPAYSFWRLTRVGGALSLSLLARTSLDNLGTLALITIGAPATQIGNYGVGVLAMLGLLILPACVGNIALPRLVRSLSDPATLRTTFNRTMSVCLALTLPLALAGIAVTPALVRLFFPSYGDSILVVQVLLGAAVARALTMVSGTLLVAVDRGESTLVANVLILLVGAAVMLASPFGIVGAAVVTAGVELVSAVVYALLARRALASHVKRQAVAR